MSGTGSRSPAERDLRLENALLMEIVSQHPDRLTREELVTRMEGWPTGADRIAILDSLQELKRSGLIRINGGVVEPTFATLRAAVIFDLV